ncbi:MAG: hypothetical protein K1X89_16765 [Myxococcaceae bacterium]|nr:hypothetical protein [Myxococcaceae bacterium]
MATATAAASTPSTSAVSLGASLKAGLLGALVSAVGGFVVYGVARAAGVEFVGAFSGPDAPVGPLPAPMILIANLVPGLVASFVFLGFTKALKAPRLPWLVISGVLAVASCVPPLTLAGASTGTRVALAVMHVIAGVCIAGNLSRLAKQA